MIHSANGWEDATGKRTGGESEWLLGLKSYGWTGSCAKRVLVTVIKKFIGARIKRRWRHRQDSNLRGRTQEISNLSP